MFLGGIERDQWREIGWSITNYLIPIHISKLEQANVSISNVTFCHTKIKKPYSFY